MKLAMWRKEQGRSQQWLATELGCSQPYISQIERAQSPIVPGPDLLERIFIVTEGAVEPNDFFELPRWRRALAAALAAITRKAA